MIATGTPRCSATNLVSAINESEARNRTAPTIAHAFAPPIAAVAIATIATRYASTGPTRTACWEWSRARTKRVARGAAAAVTRTPPSTYSPVDPRWSAKPTVNASWAKRNDPSPGTKPSGRSGRAGSIKKTSPATQSTSAATNHARVSPWAASSVAATPTNATVAPGLHTYSRRVEALAIATQSPTAKALATPRSTPARTVTAGFYSRTPTAPVRSGPCAAGG